MVHTGRRHGNRDPVLPGAPAPGETRGGADARSRRWRIRVVHAHPSPRGGARHRQRIPASTPRATPRDLRLTRGTLSRVLYAEAVQQEFRAAPRLVVRTESP